MADAKEAEDEETLRILTHVHTRLQEELEKKTEPALALLHKLTRTSAAPIRGNILRHNLVPGGAAVDGVIKLPDGTELPVDAAKAKALVDAGRVRRRRLRHAREGAADGRRAGARARGDGGGDPPGRQGGAAPSSRRRTTARRSTSSRRTPAFKNSDSPDSYKPTPASKPAIEREIVKRGL